ncbi:MAG TPA: hypothetical protein VGI97_01875 [Gemmatimonadaceae bacterium]|jgi:hypothetical protein
MRIKMLVGSSFLAVIFIAIALRGAWASALADDGTRLDVSLHGVSHVLHPERVRSPSDDCTYLTGSGAVEYCAPSPTGDAQFSMLCSVFPMMFAGLVLALASGIVTHVSPYRAKATSAALAAASLAAVFAATTIAQMAMPRALRVFDEIPLYMGGAAFTCVWIAMGFLLFAAALSTTSTMLKHT